MLNNNRIYQLLKLIIEDYIKYATPISSSDLIKSNSLTLSSATVRNEMVKLEELGYITKHHFASGRIPTTKGYQYYVENLLGTTDISNLQAQINILFRDRALSINEIIDKSCKIISEITRSATLYAENSTSEILEKIDFIPLSNNQAVVILITNSGKVLNKIVEIDNKIKVKDLKACIQYINLRIKEISLADIQNNIDFLKPIINKDIQEYESLLAEIIKSLININDTPKQNIYGISNIIQNPEFTDQEKIKNIVQIIQDNSIWDHLEFTGQVRQNSQNFEISLGEDINESCKDLAVISTSINLSSSSERKITVIGPKRMDYNRITSLLAWLTEKINEANRQKEFTRKE